MQGAGIQGLATVLGTFECGANSENMKALNNACVSGKVQISESLEY